MAARNAQGTTITFGTSGFSAEIVSVNGQGIQRAVINTSHLGSVNSHSKIPASLVDEGEVQFEFHYDQSQVPPIRGDIETITITFPDSDTHSGPGFISSWQYGAQIDNKLTGTGTITWADEVTSS